jgi:hypothetical protein
MARARPAGSVLRSDTASDSAAGTTIPPAVVIDAIWMSSISLRRASPQWVVTAAETGSALAPPSCVSRRKAMSALPSGVPMPATQAPTVSRTCSLALAIPDGVRFVPAAR